MINKVAAPIERATQVKDERLSALYGYKAYDELKDNKESLEGIKDPKNNFSINVSLGTQKSESKAQSSTTLAQESNIKAQGDVTIHATKEDLTIKGSNVEGENVSLKAKGDVNIIASENTNTSDQTSKNSSGSIGVSISPSGISGINAGYNKAKEEIKENSTTYNPSSVTANDTLTIESGKDTNIIGSKVSGDTVKADVGENLNIESLQDKETYDEKNTSSGMGVSVDLTHGGKTGIQGSVSKGKIESDYESVTDQAGIYAGEGGFDINVGKNTDLKGAVIASDATPDKNKISTDTLTYSDIQNKAEYDSSSIGANYDSRTYNPLDPNYKNQGLTPVMGVSSSGNADSTTKSAISPGTIEIRSNPNQDISGLSRDTNNSLNALGKIFDKATVQEKQELANMFGEVAFNAIGGLGLKEDSSEKVALKSIVGGIMSQIAGGSFASGATSAGFNQLIIKELTKIKDPALLQWANVIIGATVSKLTGGDALTGGSITLSDIRNNFFNHFVQEFVAEKKREVLDKVSELSASGKLDFSDEKTDIIYFEGSPGEKIFAPCWRGMVDRYGQVYISVGGSAGAGIGFGSVGTSILMTNNRSEMSKEEMENYISGPSLGISASGFIGGGISLGGSGLVGDLSIGTNVGINGNVSYTIKIGEISIRK